MTGAYVHLLQCAECLSVLDTHLRKDVVATRRVHHGHCALLLDLLQVQRLRQLRRTSAREAAAVSQFLRSSCAGDLELDLSALLQLETDVDVQPALFDTNRLHPHYVLQINALPIAIFLHTGICHRGARHLQICRTWQHPLAGDTMLGQHELFSRKARAVLRAPEVRAVSMHQWMQPRV